jgi:dolichol-phosphate mannosyltransferase
MSAPKHPQLRRWGLFNLVGLLGFGLQLTLLFVLKRFLGIGYLTATGIAVEIVVLHNFVWHEHLTWSDVISPSRNGVVRRLVRFHVANGLISIAGNLAFTALFVQFLRCPYLLANMVSVLLCSMLNFAVGDRFVFREAHEPSANLPAGTPGTQSKVTLVSKRIVCST